MKALTFLAPLFRTQSLPFITALGLSLLTLFAGIALLGVSGWFLTAAALTTTAISFNLFGPSSLIRGLSLVRILARYGEKLVGHDTTLQLLTDLRTHVFGRLFSNVPFTGRSMSHGDLVSRLTSDIDALEAIFIVGIAPVVTSVLSGLAMAVIIGTLLPSALPAYCAASGCAVIVTPAVLFFTCRRLGSRHVKASASTRGQMLNALDGHADLIAFGRIPDAEASFGDSCVRLGRVRSRLALRSSLAATTIQLLTAAALLSVLVAGIPVLSAGGLGAATLVGLLLATLASFEGAAAVVRGVARFGTALAAAERISDLTEMPSTDSRRHLSMPDSDRLALGAVTFGHDPSQPVIRALDLVVEPGERIAIIGRSGCGKSTLLSLLVKLTEAQSGDISLGGASMSNLDNSDTRSRIALLAQDAPVFMGTIRDNLLIGSPDADDERLMDALVSVRLDQFVRGLDAGLDTYVGETGRTLSVGQVRRLCLARVLLSKATILLLDEPTSSLDQEMEVDFFADLARIADGRTIIVATHAPVTVLGGFDRLYRMQAGSLAAA